MTLICHFLPEPWLLHIVFDDISTSDSAKYYVWAGTMPRFQGRNGIRLLSVHMSIKGAEKTVLEARSLGTHQRWSQTTWRCKCKQVEHSYQRCPSTILYIWTETNLSCYVRNVIQPIWPTINRVKYDINVDTINFANNFNREPAYSPQTHNDWNGAKLTRFLHSRSSYGKPSLPRNDPHRKSRRIPSIDGKGTRLFNKVSYLQSQRTVLKAVRWMNFYCLEDRSL